MRRTSYSLHSALVAAVIFTFAHLPGIGHASRPFVTEDAGVAGRKVLQLETSWDYIKWNNFDKEHVLTLVPIVGIGDEAEISVELPLMFHRHGASGGASGIGDINIVTKILLAEESDVFPAAALKTILKTTTGHAERGLGTGALDYSVVGVASKQLSSLILHGMFGYTFVGTNGDPSIRNILLYGIAAGYALTDYASLVAEYAGNRHPDRSADVHPHSIMVGATYRLSDEVTIDASSRFGTTTAAAAWNTAIGLTVTL
ncbi:MAG: transporter [Bacteroidetes bacterium]|nr:transporter [Bacteroidota bacterium]MCW5894824.1 transporter [Bacteroidota bacterium]